MSELGQFHFLRPWWLLLLIPLLWAIIALWRRHTSQSNWQDVCDPHLLTHLLSHQTGHRHRWPVVLLAIAWLLTVLALAGPTWSHLPQAMFQSQQARVVVFDLTANMAAQDLKPNRLTRARYKLLDLLKHSDEGQTGLVVFSGEPHVVSPLTQDTNTIAAMVPSLNPNIMPVYGENMAAGLTMAGDLLRQANMPQGDILLITATKPDDKALAAAKKLADEGYHTSVLGIGTSKGTPISLSDGQYLKDKSGAIVISKLDSASLKELARVGVGSYIPFSNGNQDVQQLLNSQQAHELRMQAAKVEQTTSAWHDRGRWLLWLVLPLALLCFRRGWLREITQ
ncbi:MAG: hypothetical protein CMF50_06440 [Legionellales bacterium]|nr:hypothetical protein [Legionellales bacterium]|tara:strand:+ start:8362 stop:9375 length:1014 start_codon:yes stop_codon:yes gene_type:complete